MALCRAAMRFAPAILEEGINLTRKSLIIRRIVFPQKVMRVFDRRMKYTMMEKKQRRRLILS